MKKSELLDYLNQLITQCHDELIDVKKESPNSYAAGYEAGGIYYLMDVKEYIDELED
jgi:hypothetical protein